MLRRITYSDARSQIAAEIRMRRRLIISNARAQQLHQVNDTVYNFSRRSILGTEDENPVIPVTEKTRSTSNSSIDSHSSAHLRKRRRMILTAIRNQQAGISSSSIISNINDYRNFGLSSYSTSASSSSSFSSFASSSSASSSSSAASSTSLITINEEEEERLIFQTVENAPLPGKFFHFI